jgi:hypothetical protein
MEGFDDYANSLAACKKWLMVDGRCARSIQPDIRIDLSAVESYIAGSAN